MTAKNSAEAWQVTVMRHVLALLLAQDMLTEEQYQRAAELLYKLTVR